MSDFHRSFFRPHASFPSFLDTARGVSPPERAILIRFVGCGMCILPNIARSTQTSFPNCNRLRCGSRKERPEREVRRVKHVGECERIRFASRASLGFHSMARDLSAPRSYVWQDQMILRESRTRQRCQTSAPRFFRSRQWASCHPSCARRGASRTYGRQVSWMFGYTRCAGYRELGHCGVCERFTWSSTT